VILSILLAASFRVSSAVIAVRVRLCKSMELGHGSTRASLACILTSHRVAEQPSVPVTLQHFPTRQRKKAWPAHPHPDHWFVSSRFVSSRHPIVFCCHCTLHTARTHCASIDPAAVELRLPALLLPASSTLATDTTIQHRVTIDLQPQLQSTAHLLACSSNTTTRTRTRPLPLLSAAVAGQQQQLDTRRDHSYISTRTPLQ
jgi:hypothetical protein